MAVILAICIHIAVGIAAAFGKSTDRSFGVRAVLLLPVVVLLSLAMTQYRKEREVEEEYAHKTAVIGSLPNCGDLLPLSSGDVHRQVVKGATDVIFSYSVTRLLQTDV